MSEIVQVLEARVTELEAMIIGRAYVVKRGEGGTKELVFRRTLHAEIREHYTEEELREVCFLLGFDYQEVGGKTMGEVVTEFLRYIFRRGYTGRLLEILREQRPLVAWPDGGGWPTV